MHELIRDITLCILFAWVLGLLAHFSRQPLILAYLIAGFLIGPFGMGWVKSQESINVISELGLIFMLFMIGLEIDLKKIVRAGKVILFAAGGQLIGGCLLGILFFLAIGLPMGGGKFDALYLCVACALSSTVIIVKVLYEKRELDTRQSRQEIPRTDSEPQSKLRPRRQEPASRSQNDSAQGTHCMRAMRRGVSAQDLAPQS